MPGTAATGGGGDDWETTPPPPPVRIVGVATRRDGSGLAALALPDGRSRLLRIGDEFAGLRLIAVAPGEVRLQGQDTVLVLRLKSAIGRQASR